MNTKSLGACSLLVVSVLAGCVASQPPQKNAPPAPAPAEKGRGAVVAETLVPTPICSMPEAHILINQVNLTGASPTIKVNPGQQLIPRAQNGIKWNIASNDYRFTDNGILFDKVENGVLKPQPYGPLLYGHGNNKTEYVVCFGDTSSVPDSVWSYNIRIYAKDTPNVVWRCDPTLVNSQSEMGTEQTVPCVSTTVAK